MSNYQQKVPSPINFIIFDFETGGVDCVKSAVTEIALISIDGSSLKKINEYQQLIKPYPELADFEFEYNPKAAAVSNISMELLLEEGFDIRTVAEEVLKSFEQANTYQDKILKPVLVGQNTMFDINCLHHLMHYGFKNTKTDYQKELERVLHGRRDYYGNFQPTHLDTWSIAKGWFQEEGEMLNYKLGTIVDKLGVDINNAHRAMNDVASTTEVLRRYLINLRSSFQVNQRGGREGFYFPL